MKVVVRYLRERRANTQ